MDESVKIRTVQLAKLNFGMNIRFNAEQDEFIPDMIVAQIRGYVWAQDAGKKVTISYPSDWWQAFKERWFPNWAKNKFPVIYTNKEFQVKATYPGMAFDEAHAPVIKLIESEFENARVE